MSQTEINDLRSVVANLSSTVQVLADQMGGLVRRFGTEFANERCDDAGGEAERNKERQSCAVGVDDRTEGVGVEKGDQRSDGTESGTVTQVKPDSKVEQVSSAGNAVTFGAFSGRVPVGVGVGGGASGFVSGPGSVASSLVETSSTSWSDMVESEIEASDNKDELGHKVVDKKFFSEYVRIPEVEALREFVCNHGVMIKKSSMRELAMARYTAGTVPLAFDSGAVKLKALGVVGDKIMAAVVVQELYDRGRPASFMQDCLSRSFTRNALSAICVNSGLSRHVVLPSGVDPGRTSVGGEALEVIAGVVFHSGGIDAVRKFMIGMQLI